MTAGKVSHGRRDSVGDVSIVQLDEAMTQMTSQSTTSAYASPGPLSPRLVTTTLWLG